MTLWSVIGFGVVGRAVHEVLIETPDVEVVAYDIRGAEVANLNRALSASVWFVCVPTNTTPEGRLDLSKVVAAFNLATEQPHRPLLIVKSTLGVGSCAVLRATYNRFAYVPEFLVERAPSCRGMDRLVLGVDRESLADAVAVVRVVPEWAHVPLHVVEPHEAEFVKVGANALLAAKVGLANELRDLCALRDANFERVIDAIGADRRIGRAHLDVPGPDGQFGFGGKCFPKDLDDFVSVSDGEATAFAAVARANRVRRPKEYPYG